MRLMGPVDLKKKYKAEWALVTGAGTGIGKSIAETMAVQGLNVVLVSLPDKFLDETTNALKKAFPKQKFIAVPAKFDHKTDYMPAIIEVHMCMKSISLKTKSLLSPLLFHRPPKIWTFQWCSIMPAIL